MRYAYVGLIAFAGTALCASNADAQLAQFNHNVHVDYARNNSWPHPFRGQDAASVVAPFEIMRANGWRDNNTVGDYMFRDHVLTDAGKRKVASILTQSPAEHRKVYVLNGLTAQETAARKESVELAVSEMIPTGPLPEILITDKAPSVSSGAYQTIVNRAITSTIPTPRLSKFSGLNAPPQQQTVAPQTK